MEYKIKAFIEMLRRENTRHNLVSRKSLEEEIYKHVEDSLQLNQYIDISGQELVDIGSGAGFPGLILAISKPSCQVTLVESDRKKALFLNIAADELQLPNVLVAVERAEILGHKEGFREHYQLCTSRAVAALNILLELALPLLQTGGRAILWKGRNYQQEIKAAQNALNTLNGVVVGTHYYTLTQERDRVLLVVEKTMPAPEKYPRRPGIPAKRPL
jgi:16S rRNA (guanine527-N7)-methyltransferase